MRNPLLARTPPRYNKEYPMNRYKKGHMQIKDGEHAPGVIVQGQTISFDFSKALPDDMLFMALQMYQNNKHYSHDDHIVSIMKHLISAIHESDKFNLEHGG